MKPALKFTAGAVMVLGIATAIFITSCQKDQAPSAQPAASISLQDLADKMYAVSDASGDKEITAAYEALDASQLNAFNVIRRQKDSLRFVKTTPGIENGRLSAVQVNGISEQLRKTQDLRTGIEQLAVRTFHKQFNKLTFAELDQLVATFDQDKKTAKGAAISSCEAISFNYIARTTENGGVNYYNIWNIANYKSPADCDYEYRFDGVFNVVKGTDWWTRRLLDWFGNAVSRRPIYYADANDTGILLGSSRTDIMVGGPYGALLQMRWQ